MSESPWAEVYGTTAAAENLPPPTRYDTTDYRGTELMLNDEPSDSVVDFSGARFSVNPKNSSSDYPIQIRGQDGVELRGGRIENAMDREYIWSAPYDNSACLMSKGCKDTLWRNWHLKGAWDAMRNADNSPAQGTDNAWENILVEFNKDDVAENDVVRNVSYKNILVKSSFQGFSCDPGGKYTGGAGGHDAHAHFNRCMVRFDRWRVGDNKHSHHDDNHGHGGIWKPHSLNHVRNIHIRDCVFFYTEPSFTAEGRWDNGMNYVLPADSSNNIIIWGYQGAPPPAFMVNNLPPSFSIETFNSMAEANARWHALADPLEQELLARIYGNTPPAVAPYRYTEVPYASG